MSFTLRAPICPRGTGATSSAVSNPVVYSGVGTLSSIAARPPGVVGAGEKRKRYLRRDYFQRRVKQLQRRDL